MPPELSEVLEAYGGLLTRIAASYEADPALRDDLLQEISLALWRALPNWRGTASIKTFVACVAHNRCVSHVVRRKRLPATAELTADIPDQGHGPEVHAQQREQRERLQAAVRALPLTLRHVATLMLEGFSYAEIAATLGISANNVGVRPSRARKALETALGDLNETR